MDRTWVFSTRMLAMDPLSPGWLQGGSLLLELALTCATKLRSGERGGKVNPVELCVFAPSPRVDFEV